MTTTGSLIHNPASSTFVRKPGSVRRTTHVDMAPVDEVRGGMLVGGVEMSSHARDLVTTKNGGIEVVAESSVTAVVGPGRALDSISTDPHEPAAAQLVGLPVGAGFRAAVDGAMPGQRDRHTLVYLLIEELPVATLISGYSDLYLRPMATSRNAPQLPADICEGWRSDGSMMIAINETGQIPVPMGPPAPVLDPDDPHGWHAMATLGAGKMRRRRLVDVTRGDPVTVVAMFRDTHVEPGGLETVLHEYSLTATADPSTLTFLSCTASPHVLPWVECPGAAASAGRVVGHRPDGIRALVRQDLRGLGTCTHLNDLLRSLGDVGALADLLGDR